MITVIGGITPRQKMNQQINAKYSEKGYVVYLDDEPIFAAGNGLNDAQEYLSLEHSDRTPLHRLERYSDWCRAYYLKKYSTSETPAVLGAIEYDPKIEPKVIAKQLKLI